MVDHQGNPVEGRYVALHGSTGDNFGFKGHTNEKGVFEANLVPGIKFRIRLYDGGRQHGNMLNLPEIYTAKEDFYLILKFQRNNSLFEDVKLPLVAKDNFESIHISNLMSKAEKINLISPEA
jgi:hypothetical protein